MEPPALAVVDDFILFLCIRQVTGVEKVKRGGSFYFIFFFWNPALVFTYHTGDFHDPDNRLRE